MSVKLQEQVVSSIFVHHRHSRLAYLATLLLLGCMTPAVAENPGPGASLCELSYKPYRTRYENGLLTVWDRQGKIKERGPYHQGRKSGKWTFWSPKGGIFFVGTVINTCDCRTTCLFRKYRQSADATTYQLYEQWFESGRMVAEGALMENLEKKQVTATGFFSFDGKESWLLRQHGYWRLYDKTTGKIKKEQWYVFGKLKRTVVH